MLYLTASLRCHRQSDVNIDQCAKSLLTLARILNVLGDRLELLLSEYPCIHDRNFPWTPPGLGNVVLHEGGTTSVSRFWLIFDVDVTFLRQFPRHNFDINIQERSRIEHFLIENCSYISVKLIKQYIFKSKCNCRRKSMQEKESIMVLRCKLKIPSLG